MRTSTTILNARRTLACLLALGMLAGCAGSRGPRIDGTSAAARIASIERAAQLATQAQKAMDRKDYDQAIALNQQAVMLNPNFGAAWNNLGLAFMARAEGTDYLGAQQAFNQAVSLLPGDPTPSRNLGYLYDKRGFAADALRYFNQALAIDENDIHSLRGVTKAGMLTAAKDPLHLEHLKRAQLLEADPSWHEIIRRERLRVENEINERF